MVPKPGKGVNSDTNSIKKTQTNVKLNTNKHKYVTYILTYKNLLLETELVGSADLLREEVSELEIKPKILKVNTCHSRFHKFCQKFEETIERLSLVLEEAKAEEEIQKFESESEMYFNLITEVAGRKEELKLYEQMLQEKFKKMSQPESDNRAINRLHQMTLQQKQQLIQQGQNCKITKA